MGAATEPKPHATADGVRTVVGRVLLGVGTRQHGAPVGAQCRCVVATVIVGNGRSARF